VEGGALDARVRQYVPQVALYRAGLARIYRRPVAHAWLHFLHPGTTVEVAG
jgi:hypothetical protein